MKCVAFAGIILAAFVAQAGEPVQLIFDTGIMGDVDDVGTVAVLHALANRGEAKILATGVCAENPWSPLCLDALSRR